MKKTQLKKMIRELIAEQRAIPHKKTDQPFTVGATANTCKRIVACPCHLINPNLPANHPQNPMTLNICRNLAGGGFQLNGIELTSPTGQKTSPQVGDYFQWDSTSSNTTYQSTNWHVEAIKPGNGTCDPNDNFEQATQCEPKPIDDFPVGLDESIIRMQKLANIS